MCLKQYLKSTKIFLITIWTGELFHSFGAAAKKAQSPSVVRVTTLAACRRSPLFDLKLYPPPSLILLSSQGVTLYKICNPYMESPVTVDNCYACKLIKAVGHKVRSYLSQILVYFMENNSELFIWAILWYKFYNLVQSKPHNYTEEERAYLSYAVLIFYTHSYVQSK